MPDDEDKKQLRFLIDLYEKIHPGEIASVVKYEKRMEDENSIGGADTFLVKNKQSDFRKVLALPPDLAGTIKESYPTLFKDKKHFRWFVLNFPEFRVSRKY